MKRMLKVAKQEFKMMAANKTFIILTLIGPFLILAISVGPSLLVQNTMTIQEGTKLAILSPEIPLVNQLSASLEQMGILGETFPLDQESLVRERVLTEEFSAMIIIPENYLHAENFSFYSVSGTDILLSESVNASLSHLIIAERMAEAGLNQQLVMELSAKPQLNMLKIGAEGQQDEAGDFTTYLFVALGFTMILYMTLILYGQTIGRSIVKEKTTKTVEIMLSSVSPWEMMFGKILGIGTAGLVQYAFWFGLANVLGTIFGEALSFSLPSMINGTNMAYLLSFFILAYFLYSALYAAIGSGAEDEQHLGQLSYPILIFLIIPLVLVSSITMNPSTPLAVGLSIFPLTAPIVMLVRILIQTPPFWQIALCYGLLIISIIGAVALSSKIFRVGILMSGKKFKLGEIIKWATYK